MEKIDVKDAGAKASASLKAVTCSFVLQEAFDASWKRITRDMTTVSMQSAGDLAIGTLKAAMDAADTKADLRANLIGLFCNEWNAVMHPEAHRMSKPSQATGSRSTATFDYSGTPPFANAAWKDNPTMCKWCAGTGHPHGNPGNGMCKCPDLQRR